VASSVQQLGAQERDQVLVDGTCAEAVVSGSLDGTVMDARVMGESGAMGFPVIVMPAENMTVNLESYGKFRAPAGSA
jgi:hypothetical protein